MFNRILVANRGEVACRVVATCRRLGVETVAVFAELERGALHVESADRAVSLPARATPAASYLDVDAVVDAARQSGAEAVHPGYGFLSENADFARACERAGLAFVGPPPSVMEAMADKWKARQFVARFGVPVLPAAFVEAESALENVANDVGFPVMVKASAGGGGIGLAVAESPARLARAANRARSSARRAFGSGELYLERYIPRARHVEAQVLADGDGNCLHLFERECSVQRRHQKVIEETPSPALTAEQRDDLMGNALAAARGIGYRNAGTFEFLRAPDGTCYFLEANTRLQVEHGITELTTGVDLVELQLRVAAGEPLALGQDDVAPRGHALECRVYAERPDTFLPSPGTLSTWRQPAGNGVRVDTGVREGDEVTPYFDPLLAKVMVLRDSRDAAIDAMTDALGEFAVEGVATNIPFLLRALASPRFRSGDYDTGLAGALTGRPSSRQ